MSAATLASSRLKPKGSKPYSFCRVGSARSFCRKSGSSRASTHDCTRERSHPPAPIEALRLVADRGRVNCGRLRPAMNVDVFYDGLVVQRGSAARDEAGGAFIELELPLPVGTRIAVRGPDGERQARVTRVHEGLGSGVLVQFGDAKPLGDAG